jgi:hypothetical protein
MKYLTNKLCPCQLLQWKLHKWIGYMYTLSSINFNINLNIMCTFLNFVVTLLITHCLMLFVNEFVINQILNFPSNINKLDQLLWMSKIVGQPCHVPTSHTHFIDHAIHYNNIIIVFMNNTLFPNGVIANLESRIYLIVK